MSDPVAEFLAWFDGFVEGISKRPNEAQWGKIRERVERLRLSGPSGARTAPALATSGSPAIAGPVLVAAPGAPSAPEGARIIGAASADGWLDVYMTEVDRIAASRNIRLDADDRATFRKEIDAEVYVSTPQAAAAQMMANFVE